MMRERRYLSAAIILLAAGMAIEWSVRSQFWSVLSSWRSYASSGLDIMALSTNVLSTTPTAELVMVLVVLAMPRMMASQTGGGPPLWLFTVGQVVAALTVTAIGLSVASALFFGFLFSPPTFGETALFVSFSQVSLLPNAVAGGALWYLSRAMKRYFAEPGFHA